MVDAPLARMSEESRYGKSIVEKEKLMFASGSGYCPAVF